MRISHALLSAALLAATPALAQTQPQAGHAAASQPAAKPDKYHAMLEQRITSMGERLRITPAEEPAWNAFAQTMRDNANGIEQAYRKRAQGMKTMTAADNLRDYAQIQQERARDVQTLSASFDTLYGQLSDAQKKTADAMFLQYDVQRHAAHKAAAQAKARSGGAGR